MKLGDGMFLEIFSLYLQGLMMSIIFVFLTGILWVVGRAIRKADKTSKARQAFLYDILMLAVMIAPILSFAFMAIILMFKS